MFNSIHNLLARVIRSAWKCKQNFQCFVIDESTNLANVRNFSKQREPPPSYAALIRYIFPHGYDSMQLCRPIIHITGYQYSTNRTFLRSFSACESIGQILLRPHRFAQTFCLPPPPRASTKPLFGCNVRQLSYLNNNRHRDNSGMRIATLQFAPQLGDVEGNIKRADRLLKLVPGDHDVSEEPGIEELQPDILVLPEMAFSGYNFASLQAIRPYLEVQGEGPSAQWARSTAQRLKCKVCVGYPEVQHQSSSTTSSGDSAASPVKLYNSMLVVDETGEVVHNYRKRFLYYTDESWASEGEAEWSFKSLKFPAADGSDSKRGQQETQQIPTTFGICMDINPYKFEAPFTAWEFANRVLDSQSHLVIVSAAWLVTDATAIMAQPERLPDMDTFNYWLKRFWPLIEKRIDYGNRQVNGFCTPTETKVILVFANRTGAEDGGVGSVIPRATYAGTSTIVAITQKHKAEETPSDTAKSSSSLDIKIHCWGIKGAREEGICFADTASEPEMTFVTKKADDDESD